MAGTFDDVIISVWRQTLVQNEKVVELADKRYFVKRTSRHRFRQVDFTFDGQELRGIEQNPDTRSRWARLAREKKVMQFLRNWALCGCGCRWAGLQIRSIASGVDTISVNCTESGVSPANVSLDPETRRIGGDRSR